ncbi:MAG: twin-arginine translocase TatA/TatE family subunit [Pseudomonadota bacterium]
MSLLPQFGFFELMTIGILLLVVVGPKDLPKLMRVAGRMMRQARQMAAEFKGASLPFPLHATSGRTRL